MSQDGYRLFVVSLHDNQKAAEQKFDKAQARTPTGGQEPPEVDYLDVVEQFVSSSSGKNFNIGTDPADLEEQDVGTRIGSSTRLESATRDGDAVRLKFKSGPILSEGLLSDPKGAESDIGLAGRSTLQDFRAVLLTKAGGQRAILVVEARGRSCPTKPLVRAMKSASDVPWSLRIHEHVADAAAVNSFIQQGTIEQLELIEWQFDADGHKAGRIKSLVSRVGAVSQAKGKKRLSQWAKAGKQVSQAVWKKQAGEVKNEFFSTRVDLKFNDVNMTVRHGKQTRILRPATDYKRFTYYLDDSIVSDSTFYSQALGTAKLLIEGVQAVPKQE